jgi:hypothetical protein
MRHIRCWINTSIEAVTVDNHGKEALRVFGFVIKWPATAAILDELRIKMGTRSWSPLQKPMTTARLQASQFTATKLAKVVQRSAHGLKEHLTMLPLNSSDVAETSIQDLVHHVQVLVRLLSVKPSRKDSP